MQTSLEKLITESVVEDGTRRAGGCGGDEIIERGIRLSDYVYLRRGCEKPIGAGISLVGVGRSGIRHTRDT